MNLSFNILLNQPHTILYGVTLFVSIIKYPRYYNSSLKYLPIILLYTFLNELLGIIIYKYPDYSLFVSKLYPQYNFIIYNIYNIVFYLYLYYIYWSNLDNKKQKQKIFYGAIFFLTISILNPFFENFMLKTQFFSYITGALVLLMTIVFYLQKIYKLKKLLTYKYYLLLWISIGLSVFYCGYIPIKMNRFYNIIYGIQEYIHLRKIHMTLAILMYFCFIIGFIKINKKIKQ